MKEFILIIVAVCLLAIDTLQQPSKRLDNPTASSPLSTATEKLQLCHTTPVNPVTRIVSRSSLNFSFRRQWTEARQKNMETLSFKVKNATSKPFNDSWAKINSSNKLHKAGDKDGKLDYVLKISEKMHLPASVAVVPIVESNYRTHLVSHKGAAGVWQLMPQTARDYGINREERFQLAASTRAALHLLKDLHEQFNNWELAYAAYNAGGKRVFDAIKKNPKATSIEELDLPRETKDYVQRLKKINQLIMRFANVKSDISRLIADLEY